MAQYLGGIAEPFAVLNIVRLFGRYLAGGNQIFQLLDPADNPCRQVFAESLVRHDRHYILKLNRLGVHGFNTKPAHSYAILRTATLLLSLSSLVFHCRPSLRTSGTIEVPGVERMVW